MSADQTLHDVFISYAWADNSPTPETIPNGWVTSIRDQIGADHRRFSTRPLRLFLNGQGIKDAEDWRFRILDVLQHSKMLLVCLSPNYFASAYCRREWEEYVKRQVQQLTGNEKVATVYFVEAPGSDDHGYASHIEELLRGNVANLRPWFPEGAEALLNISLKEQKDRLALPAGSALDEEGALSLVRDHQPPRDIHRCIVSDLSLGQPQFSSDGEEAAARQIVRMLGGFTIAVEQVALYLGLYPDVAPSAFLATLVAGNFPVADFSSQRDPDVAAQMLTQSKQLAIILDVTLAQIDAPTRTALTFAALHPPDCVPWFWLRALTKTQHAELCENDAVGAASWFAVRQRLTGLRLLYPGNHPEIARIHPLVAAHFSENPDPAVTELFEQLIGLRADTVGGSYEPPALWELDLLIATLVRLLANHPSEELAVAAGNLSGKVIIHRGLAAATSLIATAHAVMERLADDDPENTVLQHGLSVSFLRLGRILKANGDRAGALGACTQAKTIAERLAAREPEDMGLQRIISDSLDRLGDISREEGDLAGAFNAYTQSKTILERLAAREPENTELQLNLSGAFSRLGDIAKEQGDLSGAVEAVTQSKAISERLAACDLTKTKGQYGVALSLIRLGEISQAQGNLAAAWGAYDEGKTILERLTRNDPSNAESQSVLSTALDRLGDLAAAQGDSDGALLALNQSKTIRERLVANDPIHAEWQRNQFVSLLKLGDLEVTRGDLDGALRSYVQGITILERLAGRHSANTVCLNYLWAALQKLSDLAAMRDDLDGALRACAKGVIVCERLASIDPANAEWQFNIVFAHTCLAKMAGKKGDHSMEIAELETSLAVMNGMKGRGVPFSPAMETVYTGLVNLGRGRMKLADRTPALLSTISSLSAVEKPDLVLLGLHERHVDIRLLNIFGKYELPNYRPDRMKSVVLHLVSAGLATDCGDEVFAMHPLLSRHLRAQAQGSGSLLS